MHYLLSIIRYSSIFIVYACNNNCFQTMVNGWNICHSRTVFFDDTIFNLQSLIPEKALAVLGIPLITIASQLYSWPDPQCNGCLLRPSWWLLRTKPDSPPPSPPLPSRTSSLSPHSLSLTPCPSSPSSTSPLSRNDHMSSFCPPPHPPLD